jgi:transcriptional regulator with XRE-family HTH domain
VSRMKKHRELSGLTQTELSNLCGIERSRLSLAESGQVKLSAKEADTVRNVLIQEMEKRADRIQHELERSGQRSAMAEAVAV